MASMRLQASLWLTVLMVQWAASKDTYFIRHRKSGQAVEGGDHAIKLKDLNPVSTNQMWKIEPLEDRPGLHVIYNVGRKMVLDAEFGFGNKTKAIMFPKHSGTNQRFFLNVDHTIVADKADESHIPLALSIEYENEVLFTAYDKGPHQVFDIITASDTIPI